MSRTRAILLLALATAICAVVLLLGGAGAIWLRVLVGIPFILLLPGHAIMLSVDPDGRLGVSEWFTLAAGASISVTMLVGMALAGSVGLTSARMTTALAIVTLLALAAAQSATGPQNRTIATRRDPASRAAFGVLALLACSLLILALSLPVAGRAQAGRTVQLWGLPDRSEGGVRIGASNVDAAPHRYVLAIEQGGRSISRQEFDMPAGGTHIFVLRKTALLTDVAPVAATLSDMSGVVSRRTISVWTTP